MNLGAWQRALVGRLTGDSARYDLNGREQRWLTEVVDTAGFAVTRRVQREWRVFRIRNALPLTSRLLAGAFAELTARYLAECAQPASFFLREAEQFVAWCPRGSAPHFDAVSRFELAMLRNASADHVHPSDPPSGGQLVRTSAGTDVVRFAASPALVLGALAAGERPPPPGPARHPLLCAPAACRAASEAEAATVRRLSRHVVPAGSLDHGVVASLWDAGALATA